MKIKVSEATPRQLDWLAGIASGFEMRTYGCDSMRAQVPGLGVHAPWHPTWDWKQGGPIIEREEIGIKKRAPCFPSEQWEASGSITAKGAGYWFAVGPTPLIAVMRSFVASKLGNEVEVPDELCTSPS